jgi:hypothetical protein
VLPAELHLLRAELHLLRAELDLLRTELLHLLQHACPPPTWGMLAMYWRGLGLYTDSAQSWTRQQQQQQQQQQSKEGAKKCC